MVFEQIIMALIVAIIGSIVAMIFGWIKLPLNKQVEEYLESKAGTRQIQSIMQIECDKRHSIEKQVIDQHFYELKEAIKDLKTTIEEISSEILNIYKNKSN